MMHAPVSAPTNALEALRILDSLQQAGKRAGGGLKKEMPVFEAHVHVFEAYQRILNGDNVLWYPSKDASAITITSFQQLPSLLAS
ncbi:MAG: hypothetical protein ACYCW6_18955 [Candidatus Xenobia bacterium]